MRFPYFHSADTVKSTVGVLILDEDKVFEQGEVVRIQMADPGQ